MTNPFLQHRVATACALLSAAFAVHAQQVPDAGSLLREAERQPRTLPKPGPLATPAVPTASADTGARVTVKAFALSGNSLISTPELQAVLAPWVGRELGFTELEQASNAIAEAYRKRGWFARPQLPAQDVSTGVIRITILEAKLGDIRIDDGGKTLRMERDMVTSTMTERQKPGDPLNLDALERSSNILNDTPGVAVATILTPGKNPAESDAVVKVQDKPLFAGMAQLDNTGSRSTGDKKLSAGLTVDNPSGHGDQLSLNANAGAGNTYAKLGYALPVGRDGLRAGINASALTYKLVGADFEALASKGDGQTYGINANYPLLRSGNRNIGLAAALDRKDYYNEANALPTSRKRIHAGLVSVTGDLLDGLGAGGMTLWGTNLSVGDVDLSGNATNETADQNGPATAGSYAKLGYNLARLQRLSQSTTLWLAFNGQTANKNLDSSEKMSLGGPSGVRAYPVMEGSGDTGWLTTLEARYNITPDVQVVAFYDRGFIQQSLNSDYTGAPLVNTGTLAGAGLGVNWARPGSFIFKAMWGRRIGDNPFAQLLNGADQDGSLDQNRFWFTLTVPFDFAGPGAASRTAKAATPAASTSSATAPATSVAAAPVPAPVAPVAAPALVAAATPAKVAPAPATPTVPAAPDLSPVRNMLESWRQAWASRNVEAYLSHYANDFRPEPPLKSRKAWVAQRKSRLAAARGVTIEVVEPQISLQDSQTTQATAVFTQRYRSKQHTDVVRKTLTLQRVGDAWRIVSETQTKLP